MMHALMAAVEATERSMPSVMMTRVWPKANARDTEYCRRMLNRFEEFTNVPPEAMVNPRTRITSITSGLRGLRCGRGHSRCL